jgi:hypothetical protein
VPAIRLSIWYLTVAGLTLFVDGSAQAQTARSGASVTSSFEQQPPLIEEGFRALDLFGGWAVHNANGSEGATEDVFKGWGLGGTVRFIRWLGLTGSLARTSSGDLRLLQFLAGPTFIGPYGELGIRGFAHVLGGGVSASSQDGFSESGFQLIAGAGFDFFFFRMQVDYTRYNLDGPASGTFAKNQVRGFIGGVAPLCFRGCQRAQDGIDLTRKQ